MSLDVSVNGASLDLDDGVTVAAIVSELRRQGWKIQAIRVDGAELSVERAGLLDRAEGQVEFEAEEPPEDFTPAPPAPAEPAGSAASEGDVAGQLVDSLSRFRTIAENLGNEFSRGHWREALNTLTRWLEEFQVALQGFQAIQSTRPGGAEYIAKMPGLLHELAGHLQQQSWVEVADLLLYDFVPTIEEWEKAMRE